MDGSRFDKPTKALASGTSRRSLLEGVAGSTVAGLLAVAGGQGVGAVGSTHDGQRRKTNADFYRRATGRIV